MVYSQALNETDEKHIELVMTWGNPDTTYAPSEKYEDSLRIPARMVESFAGNADIGPMLRD